MKKLYAFSLAFLCLLAPTLRSGIFDWFNNPETLETITHYIPVTMTVPFAALVPAYVESSGIIAIYATGTLTAQCIGASLLIQRHNQLVDQETEQALELLRNNPKTLPSALIQFSTDYEYPLSELFRKLITHDKKQLVKSLMKNKTFCKEMNCAQQTSVAHSFGKPDDEKNKKCKETLAYVRTRLNLKTQD